MKKSQRLGMRIAPEDKARWEKLAHESGMSLSSWLQMCANIWVCADEHKKKQRPIGSDRL